MSPEGSTDKQSELKCFRKKFALMCEGFRLLRVFGFLGLYGFKVHGSGLRGYFRLSSLCWLFKFLSPNQTECSHLAGVDPEHLQTGCCESGGCFGQLRFGGY